MSTNLPDFDVLLALYRHDPQALEDFRRHMLREAVDFAPVEHRPVLEQLLQRIEEARTTAADPMDAALIAFRMMGDSVRKLNEGWENALEAVAELQTSVLLERLRSESKTSLAGSPKF